ncbi:hypothetical protein B7P43_G13751 [Cryptotermes secundus]|uniref:Uncharacterized protein n=1 Tax=Cryptotermes secundus TaxID=105785 RepID=A0A2J7QGK1_9NEOP|nr:hypothetical protein B7P43_G13751 [Cryptotermes secundus]
MPNGGGKEDTPKYIHTYIHSYMVSQILCPETGLDIELVTAKLTLQCATRSRQ